jgi:hypothetical protein
MRIKRNEDILGMGARNIRIRRKILGRPSKTA